MCVFFYSQGLERMPARTRKSMSGRWARGLGRIAGGMKKKKRSLVPKAMRNFASGSSQADMFQPVVYVPIPRKAEIKTHDVQLTWAVDSTTETSSSAVTGQILVGLAEGVTEGTRVGHSINIKRIQIRGDINQIPGAGATNANLACLWLIQDKQTNGAQASFDDIFNTSGAGVAPRVLLDQDRQARFKVLWCKTFDLSSLSGTTGAYNNRIHPIDVDLRVNIDVEFTGAAGAITEFSSNNLFFASGATTDDTATVSCIARVLFTDV